MIKEMVYLRRLANLLLVVLIFQVEKKVEEFQTV